MTGRPGSLAAELKERLEERMRIVDDPAMQARAMFLKQTINAMVGMSGHKTNPYSDRRVTGCITATGRRLLEACHRFVSDITLAGYTDSLFLKLPRPSTNKDPLDAWLSQSLVAQHEVRFQSVIKNELDGMARTFRRENGASVRFQCKQIAMAGLFSGKAHAYAAAYLMFDKTKEGDCDARVDVQVKGSLKSASMECSRAFNDALIRISVVGEFLMSEGGVMRLGDIHALTSAAPVCVMTSAGWKTAVKVTTWNAQRGAVEAIVRYGDDTESRHCFLPQANAEGLVEVTHVVCTERTGSCIDRRRLSVVAMTKMFCLQLCYGRLPLSLYSADKTGNVLVKLEDGSSRALPPFEVARNGQRLDLEEYRQRWIKSCVDSLTCRSCCRQLTDADECRCLPSHDGQEPTLIHESCSTGDTISLEKISASFLSSNFKSALSAIVVAGTRNGLEAVKNLIDLRKTIDATVSGEQPPTQTYEEVLAQLKATVTDGESSKDYACSPEAFLCIPDGRECWFRVPSKPTSKTVLDLVYKATRIIVRHGRYRGRASVLEAVATYPAHRLRISPPPVFAADKKAPNLEWEKVVTELAESATRPKLTTAASFHCQTCATVYNLEIGACGHLACKVCSVGWKICHACKVEWRGLKFAGTPQMNYHPKVFPFDDWYTYLPATGWYVYSGPDELIYDSSAKHIICLARGELHR